MTCGTISSRRIVAGLGVVGAVASIAVVGGFGPASAASGLTYWEDGNSRFEMTVSDTTPAVGDTITLSTNFQRKWSFEDVYNYKALVDGCLRYVEGSGNWQGSPVGPTRVSVETAPAGTESHVRLESTGGGAWRVPGAGSGFGAKRTISMDFVVTTGCATGKALGSTMHYGGSLGDGIYRDKGPKITVAKPDDPEAPEVPDNGGDAPGDDNGSSGSLDTGSLGGLFG